MREEWHMQQTLMEIGFVVSCVLGVCCIVFSTANEVYEYASLSSPWKPWNTPGKISYLKSLIEFIQTWEVQGTYNSHNSNNRPPMDYNLNEISVGSTVKDYTQIINW